ncbi:Glutamine synthetase [Entamoeba marina]
MASQEVIHKDIHYSKYVFTTEIMEKKLPRSAFLRLKELIEKGGTLDASTADVVAFGMKEWAASLGATCFTHWFQPISARTARKYDCFLNVKHQCSKQHLSHLISEFTGKQLIQGESDGSSFPNGGLRNTFQARGYSAWDYNSPVFVIEEEFGGVLYIPAVFCSIFGLSLDSKTPLMRSERALDETITRCIDVIHTVYTGTDFPEEISVAETVGLEQEMFIIDSEIAKQREDIISTGRTLVGRVPPRSQQLKDHYWGVMPQRIISCLEEVKERMWELGIPITTIHNEVAPAQYEVAPVFERGSVAVDHNIIFMEQTQAIAHKHGLHVMFHEKPFDGVNGSGKHLNWALFSNGQNLMTFGTGEYERIRFLFLASAVLKACDEHYELLRAASLSPGNSHRLGGYEAPTPFISVFVGERLERCIDEMLRDEASLECSPLLVSFGTENLPSFARDQSDRNRTSPFAFIGNRFEFRAVGSSQNPSWPLTVINTIVAAAARDMINEVEVLNRKGASGKEAIEFVIKETLKNHNKIIYNGDCYSEEYKGEMSKRGYEALENMSEVLDRMLQIRNIDVFEKLNVMSKQETAARIAIWEEFFVETILIEAETLAELTERKFAACTLKNASKEANALYVVKGDSDSVFKERINSMVVLSEEMLCQTQRLKEFIDKTKTLKENTLKFCEENIVPSMAILRKIVDRAEGMIDKDVWNFPCYEDLWNKHCL